MGRAGDCRGRILVAAPDAESAARVASSVSDPEGRLLYAFRLPDLLAWAGRCSAKAAAAVADPRLLPRGSPQAAAVAACVAEIAWTEDCFVRDAVRLLSSWGIRPAPRGTGRRIPRVEVIPRAGDPD